MSKLLKSWWAVTGSNRRPSRCKRPSLYICQLFSLRLMAPISVNTYGTFDPFCAESVPS